jgi:hypothetical protein
MLIPKFAGNFLNQIVNSKNPNIINNRVALIRSLTLVAFHTKGLLISGIAISPLRTQENRLEIRSWLTEYFCIIVYLDVL